LARASHEQEELTRRTILAAFVQNVTTGAFYEVIEELN